MGNLAKYWYKSNVVVLHERLEKRLKELGFVPVCEYQQNDSHYEKVYEYYEDDDGVKYIHMIYAEETQIASKDAFEDLMKECNIPIQKWMEG